MRQVAWRSWTGVALVLWLGVIGVARGDVYGGSAAFAMGINSVRMSNLATTLRGQGMPVFSKAFLTLAGTGDVYLGHVAFGFDGGSFFGNSASNTSFETSVRGTYWAPRIGFLVLSWRNLLAYGLLGVGSSTNRLTITDRVNVLQSEYERSSSFYDLSLAADYLFIPETEQEWTATALFGFRIGYGLSFVTSGWRPASGNTYALNTALPHLPMTGPYFRITLGAGWIRLDRDETDF